MIENHGVNEISGMNTCVALLRGINVGGKNTLPMKDLVTILEDLGCTNVRTYIQSGNVVYRSQKKCSNKTAKEIGSNIMASHGFEPNVMLLDESELDAAVENNPFKTHEGKGLHFYFLEATPKNPNLAKLTNLKSASEEFRLDGSVFYLYAPDGIGRSKLAAAVERNMGVAATARNWNTVTRLLSMVGAANNSL